jgi:hypothetical protein
MKKKRILKDPDTGEIVGATRTPFSHQAKELNKQIFAEEFERKRVEEETPEESSGARGYLFGLVLLGLVGLGIFFGMQSKEKTSIDPKPSPSEGVPLAGESTQGREGEAEPKPKPPSGE